jgi:hypothetical protein
MTWSHIDTILRAPWAYDLTMEADSAFVLPLVVDNDNAPVELPCDVEQSQCD